jgi:hypothetical protein
LERKQAWEKRLEPLLMSPCEIGESYGGKYSLGKHELRGLHGLRALAPFGANQQILRMYVSLPLAGDLI